MKYSTVRHFVVGAIVSVGVGASAGIASAGALQVGRAGAMLELRVAPAETILYGGTPAYRACVISQALARRSGRGPMADIADAQITCAWSGFSPV